MFLHDSHSHRKEIGMEHFICIRIAKKLGSPNIPNLQYDSERLHQLTASAVVSLVISLFHCFRLL